MAVDLRTLLAPGKEELSFLWLSTCMAEPWSGEGPLAAWDVADFWVSRIDREIKNHW